MSGAMSRPAGALPASVIVLTWNGRQWIDGCVQSLLTLTPPAAEILLVDNGSTDGTIEHVRRTYPTVRVVALESNVGFAAGNNAGARVATAPHLAFLNNDTRVEPGWLAALVRAVESEASVGLVTSRVVYMDRPDVVDSAGDGYLRCGGAFKRAHGAPVATTLDGGEVFGACGAAFLIRRQLFERLGGFDEDFFMVYEDVDLSYRARLAGWRCLYVPEALVHHAGSPSLGRVSDRAVSFGQRNLEWTWLKNTPAPLLWRSLGPHLLYTLAAAAGYARQGQLGPWLRGKAAAIRGFGPMLRKRREVQRTRTADPMSLWALMETDWIGVKRREKQFDFVRRGAFHLRDRSRP